VGVRAILAGFCHEIGWILVDLEEAFPCGSFLGLLRVLEEQQGSGAIDSAFLGW
jgi:hypothetical protein